MDERMNADKIVDALRVLTGACEAEYCSPDTDGEGDDEKVAFPEEACNITFGMIRKARAALAEHDAQPAQPSADAESELLRLTARVQELERENAELRDGARQHINSINGWADRAERAEAELAAIKKRIDGSPEGDVVADIPGGVLIDVEGVSSRSLGKRVALLPLDDEAKEKGE